MLLKLQVSALGLFFGEDLGARFGGKLFRPTLATLNCATFVEVCWRI